MSVTWGRVATLASMPSTCERMTVSVRVLPPLVFVTLRSVVRSRCSALVDSVSGREKEFEYWEPAALATPVLATSASSQRARTVRRCR